MYRFPLWVPADGTRSRPVRAKEPATWELVLKRNPVERLKQEKAPLGIRDELPALIAAGYERMPEEDVVRLQWWGLYHDKPKIGTFMLRVKIPSGILAPATLRRIGEGACLIRSKGEAGTGNVVEAVRHLRTINAQMRRLASADASELFTLAKELGAPLPLVQEVAATGELPVPLFCAGGISTPADASLVMQLGAQSVFVGSGIFKSDDPVRMAQAIVEATTHYEDPSVVAKASTGLGEAMRGFDTAELEVRLAERGW